MNRLGLTASQARDLWNSCRRKHAYDDQDEAQQAIFWLPDQTSLPIPYPCRWGDHWHVGREPPPKRPPRMLPGEVSGPRAKSDILMLDVLGARAWGCGCAESTGNEPKRRGVVRDRAASVQRVVERRARRRERP
jgi:hypothetical protein